MELLQKALSKFPNDLKSAGALAAIQFGQHNFAEAEETLKKAVAQAPQSAQAALALANLYLLENKKLEAEPELRRAIQLDPSNAPALLSLGALQLQTGRAANADETHRKVSAIPGANLAHIHAAFLFQQGKKSGSGRGTGKASQGSYSRSCRPPSLGGCLRRDGLDRRRFALPGGPVAEQPERHG